MDRDSAVRLIAFMLLALAIFMGWQYLERSRKPAAPPAAPQAPGRTDVAAPAPAPGVPAGAVEATDLEVVIAPPADPAAYEGPILGDATYHGKYAMAVRLTAHGAGIAQIRLSDYFASAEEREKPDHSGEKFELVQAGVGSPGFVLRRLDFIEKGREARKLFLSKGLADAWWRFAGTESDGAAVFELRIVDKDRKDFLTVRKRYRVRQRPEVTDDDPFLDGAAYAMDMELEFVDHGQNLRSIAFTMQGPEGLVAEETRGVGQERQAVGGFADAGERTEFKTGENAVDKNPAKRTFPSRLDWAGVVNKYFAVVAAANPPDVQDTSGRFESTVAYSAYEDAKAHVPGVLMTSYQVAFEAADGPGLARQRYLVFAGPKDGRLLEKPVLRRHGLEQLIRWSGLCCFSLGPLDTVVAAIARVMVWAIDEISLLVRNKGLAVIILVILVRVVLFPISRYSQLSMLKMQDLQPEVSKLKDQFKGDQQRLQMEQMKLFRKHGANPVLGCVPMMLQMPIWIALYTGLAVAISLRQAPFVWWINDLARPDAAFGPFEPVRVWGVEWLGNWAHWQVNLLPVLMVVAMFLQMKLQPQAAASTPEVEKQQKLMKFFMPAMLLWFLYSAPSALNLYILTSSLLGYAEQKYIRWQHAQARLRPPKPPKPKKPKGPIGRVFESISGWMESRMEDAQRLQKGAKKSDSRWDKPAKR